MIVKVEKNSEQLLNTLESLQLNVCLEMDNFILFSVNSTESFVRNNIEYTVLTIDHQNQPLVVVSDKKGIQSKRYIGDIVLDSENIRLERMNTPYVSISEIESAKIIPLRVYNKVYRNIRKVMPDISFKTEQELMFNTIINSVNADTLSHYIQILEDFGTRFALHENRFEIADWIYSQFRRFGYTDVELDHFIPNAPFSSFPQRNVIATKTGTLFPDKYIVVGAHYDSINFTDGSSAISMTFAPGADDNASGTAAVLEIARLLKLHDFEPLNSIRFITFAFEEGGLHGAYRDVDRIMEEDLDVIAMINSDMIAYSPSSIWNFVLINYPNADFLTNTTVRLADELDMNTHTTNLMMRNSDSWAYHNAGIPAIFMIEADFNPHYHTSSDLNIHMNRDYHAQYVKLKSSLAMTMSSLPPTPTNFALYDLGNGTSLFAEWDTIDLAGISYQVVVRNNQTEGTITFATADTLYTIMGLTNGISYTVTISSVYDEIAGIGVSRTAIPLDRPSMVQNFTEKPSFQKVKLNWQHNSELNIENYKIYRRVFEVGEFVEIICLPPDANTWEDTTTLDTVWYEYKINAVNTLENSSPDSQILKTRHVSHCSGILVLDMSTHLEDSLLYPSMEQVSGFYNTILEGFTIAELSGERIHAIRLSDLGIYSTVIIQKSSVNQIAQPNLGSVFFDVIENGGNIILTSFDPLHHIDLIPISYPVTYDSSHIVYTNFKINSVNRTSTTRLAQGTSTGWLDLPNLDIDPTKAHPSFNNKLNRIEVFTGDYVELYLHTSFSDTPAHSAFDGMSVAIYSKVEDSHIVIMSIPLYFVIEDQVIDFMKKLLTYFGEQHNGSDPPKIYTGLELQNYPNPFNPITYIEFNLSQAEKVDIRIFNIKGQLVKSYLGETYIAGKNMKSWDGTDKNGNGLSSGVYFYQVTTESGQTQSRKMVLLK
jgi:hypothetical protein